MSEILMWLQQWYIDQCNGEWEHQYGIKFDTLDNPGWYVVIDLNYTKLENKFMGKIIRDNGSKDWIICEVKDKQFVGSGDALKLSEIIKTFQQWVQPNEFY